MKLVDMNTWKRKKHFEFFNTFDYPHFNICANVDITHFYSYIKDKGHPFFISMLYISSKAVNSVKELRFRIRGEQVVEHEAVSPHFTLMTSEEVFTFCPVSYVDDFKLFAEGARREMDRAKVLVALEDERGRDDLIFVSSIPWVSFTGIVHPIHMNPVDSVPRVTWGKYFEENGRVKLPLSIQAHHALVDGAHIGQFFSTLQELADNPEKYL